MTTDTRRRVKLYALNAERQWDDRGTGHVSSNYVDRLKGISLLVRAESDGSLLLESKIQPDTAYQKQQDTLIVWSEGDNFDLALSFQEKAGCDEIWEKICQVQGKDPSVEITQDIVEESEDERFEDMSDTAPPIELPPCELARLEDISETIQNCLATQLRKEKLSMALESDNYIKKLLNLFHVCEDLEITEGLHHLFEIFKNIFLLNKNALFEIMFSEDTIFDVVGCLEYDPSLTQPKKHRQYLKQLAKFREAVPIKNQDLLAKIHQTFRVQYIQDIILPTPSVFVEDNMLNTLSSFIFFNKVEIVTLIQEDERFLVDMFTMLTDTNTSDTKRRDIVLFLKEFCNYAQNLQPQGKDSFYKTLTCLGILQALEITLPMNDQKTKAASIDILTAIVEFSPLVVRNYTLQQANRTENERMLLNIAIEQMLTDSEPELGVAVQLMGIIKILLEPENMLTEKGDFLNFFYKHSIQTLIAPLLLNTIGDRPQADDYQTAQLLGIVLDILSFCVEHHTYHIKNFIIQKDLLKRILVLMKSTHTFLVLGALRLLRKIIALKDEFYNRHIIKGNLFAPVVDAFIRNNGRYNLLESAILELFEFVKLEDIKTLCVYFVENFSKIFDEIEYVQTFKYLKNRYDQYQDRLKDRDKMSLDTTTIPIIRSGRFRRDQRQMEEEEEMWFNEEEDFAEELDTYNSVMKAVTPEKNGPNSCSPQGPCQQKSPPHTAQTQQQQPQQQQQQMSTSTANPAATTSISETAEEDIDTENIDPASLSVNSISNNTSILGNEEVTAQQQQNTELAHMGAVAVVAALSQQQQQQNGTLTNYQSHQSQLNLVAAAAAVVAANDRLSENECQRTLTAEPLERVAEVNSDEKKEKATDETGIIATTTSTGTNTNAVNPLVIVEAEDSSDGYSDAAAAQLLTSIASSNSTVVTEVKSQKSVDKENMTADETISNSTTITTNAPITITTTKEQVTETVRATLTTSSLTTTTIATVTSTASTSILSKQANGGKSSTYNTSSCPNNNDSSNSNSSNMISSSSNSSSCSSEQRSDSSNESESSNGSNVPTDERNGKESVAVSTENILKKGLVDYESDSGDEYAYDEEEDGPQEKKARLA